MQVYIPKYQVYATVVARYDNHDSVVVALPNGRRETLFADEVRYVAPPAQAVACV